jgi:hypothetical protein
MTGEPYAGVGQSDTVYVQFGDCGSVYALTPDGQLTESLSVCGVDMVPLLGESLDRDAILSALAGVRLSRSKREELAEILDADPEDVGKAAR